MTTGLKIRKENFIIYVLAWVLLIMLLSVGFWTPPFSDDFYRFVDIRSTNPVKHAITRYLTWDGRELNLFSIIRNTGYYVFYSSPGLVNFVWGLVFALGAYFTALMLQRVFDLKLDRRERFVFSVIVITGYWIALFPYVGELIYWSSIYKLLIANILFFVFYYEAVFKNNPSGHRRYVMAFTAFLLGSSGVFTIGLFAVYLVFMFLEELEKKPGFRGLVVYFAFLVLPFIIGSLYVNLAPSYGKYEEGISLNVLDLLADFFYLTGMLTCTGLYPYLIGAGLGVLVKLLAGRDFDIPLRRKLIATFKWLFVGMGAYYALMPAYFKLNCRHSFVFSVFLVLFLVYLIVYFVPVKKLKSLSPANFTLVLLLVFLFFVFSALERSVIFYKTQYKPRLDQVNAQRYHDATVCNIDESTDPFRYKDIKSDPEYWVNVNYAMYYKLNSVATDSCCSYYHKHKFYWPRMRLYRSVLCTIQWKINCRLKRKK